MIQSVINNDIERPVLGYALNATFTPRAQQLILDLQQQLAMEFGEALWLTPPSALHITLLDWIAPLVDYRRDKGQLFQELFAEYDQVLLGVLANEQPTKVRFDQIKVGPSAIYIEGHDDGQFARIRAKFLEAVELVGGTKLPPKIIHSTLARFTSEVPLPPIEKLAKSLEVAFIEQVDGFRLVKETLAPMLEYETVKQYSM